MSFLAEHGASIAVLVVIAAIVALALWRMVRGWQRGETSCGSVGGCAGCGRSGECCAFSQIDPAVREAEAREAQAHELG